MTLGGALVIASTFLVWARPGDGMVLPETVPVPAEGGGQVGVPQVGPGPGPWVPLAGAATSLLGLALRSRGARHL